ncbi:ACT domain-containing protein [Streptomyces sp. MMG1121]|uniref:ACT domain-containing protein n=1 Tax=Streptomyces sp. MMG1121 TaxID=1415544 RepID=UPI0006ADA5AD|nr:ACT domain-containing protein [Streptomyces sp. MMG1121]KOV67587.1 hypothetical protein ADK64_09660 [Streptomyces sp. MMG1121]
MSELRRRLRVLPGRFGVALLEDGAHPVDESWFAAVRGPEGLTVVQEVRPGEQTRDDWAGLYGDDAHDLDAPGMLAAVVGPLGARGIPVFVASTYHSDVILVPHARLAEALTVLTNAGHEVTGPA